MHSRAGALAMPAAMPTDREAITCCQVMMLRSPLSLDPPLPSRYLVTMGLTTVIDVM